MNASIADFTATDSETEMSGTAATGSPAATTDLAATGSPAATTDLAATGSLGALIPWPDDETYPNIPAEEALDLFLEWVEGRGFELWDHQEEALFDLAAGDHVILGTPTGSGKTLVALGLLFIANCTNRRAYYTAPIKALVNERFFELVEVLGKDNVGMLTGDAVINPDAPVICCTAEILAQDALRFGETCDVGAVVMDEFHYLADRDRGWAWQVPLLSLPRVQFLLMSATLGDVSHISDALVRLTGRDVSCVLDAPRPVPLTYEYVETPLETTVELAIRAGKAPIYVVHFSQQDAVKSAQALASYGISNAQQRESLKRALRGARFTTAFGKTLQRLLACGVGVHHAGMLPRYRLLVERLAQQGLLPVICGTDTLGVGINVPIHTVLLTALAKFDGHHTRRLSAREFHQVVGRAGRSGFDTEGIAIAQATEYDIERARALAKAGGDAKRARKIKTRKPPTGFVGWNRTTFDRLRAAEPEALRPRLTITNSMVLAEAAQGGSAWARTHKLIDDSLQTPREKEALKLRADELFATLLDAGIIERCETDMDDVDDVDDEVVMDVSATKPDDATLETSCTPETAGEPEGASAPEGTKPEGAGTPEGTKPELPAVEPDRASPLRLTLEMPDNFALDQPLSPFLLAAIELLEPDTVNELAADSSQDAIELLEPDTVSELAADSSQDASSAGESSQGASSAGSSYALDLISMVEATLEDPIQVLRAQEREARGAAIGRMKAQGIEYDERMERIQEVTYPKPLEDLLEAAFAEYCAKVPWAADYQLSCKSVLREMVETGSDFKTYIAHYKIARSEGTLLRYLSDAYHVLDRTIPPDKLDERLEDIIAWLRMVVTTTDSSLVDEWEGTGDRTGVGADLSAPTATAVVADRHALTLLVRNALFSRVRLASLGAFDELGELDSAWGWRPLAWRQALDAYYDVHEEILLDADARSAAYFEIDESDEVKNHIWHVHQVFRDENDDHDFGIWGDVDLDTTQEEGSVVFVHMFVGFVEDYLRWRDRT